MTEELTEETTTRNLEPQIQQKPKLLLLGWGKWYDEHWHGDPRCSPLPLVEYYELLASAEIITLDYDSHFRPDIVFWLDNSTWWQNPVFAPWLGQFDIIIDSISWLVPYFDKKNWEYKPLFKESITRLLVPCGRFIGYDNPWFIETRINPTREKLDKIKREFQRKQDELKTNNNNANAPG